MTAINTAEPLPSMAEQTRNKYYHFDILVISRPVTMIMIEGQPPIFPQYTVGDINARNNRFVDHLEELRSYVENEGYDLSARKHNEFINSWLKELRSRGISAYNKIISEEFRDSLELIRQKEQKIFGLNFRTPPELSFFWEMLYPGTLVGPVKPELFWGFRYPLGRPYSLPKIHHLSQLNAYPGILSIIHKDLPYSIEEVRRLAELIKAKQSLAQLISLQLLDDYMPMGSVSCDSIMDYFVSQGFQHGILHFACHCENPELEDASQAIIVLTIRDEELTISLETFESYLSMGGFAGSPFVFLNVCQSTTIGHLLESANFPEIFMRFGAGGVIATACTVPDEFASVFAAEFYSRLLHVADHVNEDIHLPCFISEVLLETRLYFLKKYNNPLGLAYGLYALSNQKIKIEA